MRILYVLTSLGVGGAERMTLALAEGMSQKGHTVCVLVLRPRQDGDLSWKRPTVHLDMMRNPASVVAALMKARRFAREFAPDVVHSHSFHANIFARMLKLMLPSLAVLSTVHNVYEGGRLRMLAYGLTERLSRRTAFVCEAAARRFIAAGAARASRSLVIRNAVALEQFRPDAERRSAIRRSMGIGDEFVWLTAGRNAPAKDHPTLLGAFKRVCAAFPRARLWIAGATEPEWARGAEGEPCGRVRWLGMREDVAALLDAADAVVMSSRWEGIPLALVEAMAMEKLVVATDVGGIRELTGDAALLTAPGDEMELANAMKQTMGLSAEERMAAGCAARRRIEQGFSLDARIGVWEGVYKGCWSGTEPG